MTNLGDITSGHNSCCCFQVGSKSGQWFFRRYVIFSVETMSQGDWLTIVNFVLGMIVFFLLFLFVFWLVRQVIANERAYAKKQEENSHSLAPNIKKRHSCVQKERQEK